MKIRIPVIALMGLIVLGSSQEAKAQPVAPVRPSFSPFLGIYAGGGGGFGGGRGLRGGAGYYGLYRPAIEMQQMQAEMAQTAAYIANAQAAMNGMVSAALPQTGRGAVYNNLGHWYPASKYGSAGGGIFGPRYGMVSGLTGFGAVGLPSNPAIGIVVDAQRGGGGGARGGRR